MQCCVCIRSSPQYLDSSFPSCSMMSRITGWVREVTPDTGSGRTPSHPSLHSGESCEAGAEHRQSWLSRFGATNPGGPMGQDLQQRHAQQLPWHHWVWEGLSHPAHPPHGFNWREQPGFGAKKPFFRCNPR